MWEPRWPKLPLGADVAVLNVLNHQPWTDGPATEDLENKLAAFTGDAYAVAFNSCTSALHATVLALNPGDGDIITAALGFPGTITGAGHTGARLVFRDVDPQTLTLRHPGVPSTATSADPHGLYLPCDLHGVPWLALDRMDSRIPVLADSCQALGTQTHQAGRGWGHLRAGHGGARAWSFSPTKICPAPDGGAITTSDLQLAGLLAELRNYGMRDGDWGRGDSEVIHRGGHNWRISEVSAAVAAASLADVPKYADRALNHGSLIGDALDAAGVRRQHAPPGTSVAWHKIRVASLLAGYLDDAGIPWHSWGRLPLHRHRAYDAGPWQVPVAEQAAANMICLGTEDCPPWTWTSEEVAAIVTCVKNLPEAARDQD